MIYLRSSEELPALSVQENAIKDYMFVHGMSADKIEVDNAPLGMALDERKEFKSFIHSLLPGDRLFVYDLRAISPRVGELVQFFNCLFEHGLSLVITKYAMIVDEKTAVNALVKLLNAIREENRRSGKMGRPKGSISKSKYDQYREKIIQMIKEGRSVTEIAKEIGASRTSIRDYIVSRNLKKIALGGGIITQELPKQQCKIDERNEYGYSDS